MAENIKLSNYLNDSLIFIDQIVQSSDQLFEMVSHRGLQLGYVREDFLERVKEREATFPTGIQLSTLGVAIPHTDAECILKEFVAIVISPTPITFKSMEDLNQTVAASVVFVLGLNRPHAQLEMLQSLMSLIQNDDILNQLINVKSNEELITIVKTNKF
ncbi:PTS sugar transporter subunit IIA [Streptococcus ferus]|uniref:PTS sugar transporter subunit IIA n=1 Tax=Streptococcus ferus TaxID=1345 RepID=UPI0023523A67|nr:PTS sugar transporter subunit IIA [Streptococcus ferus]